MLWWVLLLLVPLVKFSLDMAGVRVWRPVAWVLDLTLLPWLLAFALMSHELWWKLGDVLASLGLVSAARAVFRLCLRSRNNAGYARSRLRQLAPPQ